MLLSLVMELSNKAYNMSESDHVPSVFYDHSWARGPVERGPKRTTSMGAHRHQSRRGVKQRRAVELARASS